MYHFTVMHHSLWLGLGLGLGLGLELGLGLGWCIRGSDDVYVGAEDVADASRITNITGFGQDSVVALDNKTLS